MPLSSRKNLLKIEEVGGRPENVVSNAGFVVNMNNDETGLSSS